MLPQYWVSRCVSRKFFAGHKIWLTHEADAKSWSSLKHVQPKDTYPPQGKKLAEEA
jgi:hypothetical protein